MSSWYQPRLSNSLSSFWRIRRISAVIWFTLHNKNTLRTEARALDIGGGNYSAIAKRRNKHFARSRSNNSTIGHTHTLPLESTRRIQGRAADNLHMWRWGQTSNGYPLNKQRDTFTHECTRAETQQGIVCYTAPARTQPQCVRKDTPAKTAFSNTQTSRWEYSIRWCRTCTSTSVNDHTFVERSWLHNPIQGNELFIWY